MMIVDAHLDLSYNALRGREVLRPAREQTADVEGVPTVGLPDLRAGDVALICATVFTSPSINGQPGYRNADEAHAEGQRHLAWYHRQIEDGVMQFIASRQQIAELRTGPRGGSQSAILLLEGADPLRLTNHSNCFSTWRHA